MNIKIPNLEIETESTLDSLPPFYTASRSQTRPAISDVPSRISHATNQLPLMRLDDGASIAIGVGSRGIQSLPTIVETVSIALSERGFDPVIIPAMGSHGGATADGQRQKLADLGITEESVGCAIDAHIKTQCIGDTLSGHPVHFATAALDADGVIVLNRIKPHTNFSGTVESGLSKMIAVGLGKQRGAEAFHTAALQQGYVTTIRQFIDVIQAEPELELLGGIGVVENRQHELAVIESIPGRTLPEAEESLLEIAYDELPTLPVSDLDLLVINEIGKDISGTGMDTNVIGRYGVVSADDPSKPNIDRIVVLGLTEETQGNAHGIGLADLTTTAVLQSADLEKMYTNALASSSLTRSKLPIGLPSREDALVAGVQSTGVSDVSAIRMAVIEHTNSVSPCLISADIKSDLSQDSRWSVSDTSSLPNNEKITSELFSFK